MANEQGLDLVTILPEFIMGPVLTLAAAESSLSSGFFKARLQHLLLGFKHRPAYRHRRARLTAVSAQRKPLCMDGNGRCVRLRLHAQLCKAAAMR